MSPASEEPPGPVLCRHCGKAIYHDALYWTDADGYAVCVKYTGTLPATPNDFVYHEPMPAGLRGAPKEEQ